MAKSRLPFAEVRSPLQGAARTGGRVIIAALFVFTAALTLYMGFVVRHPLTSVYVIAPAIGAAWFGLRLFMMFGPKR